MSDRNSVLAEIRYWPKVLAETIGIGIGFGSEFFFSKTETFFFLSKFFKQNFKFFHVFLLPNFGQQEANSCSNAIF